MRQATAELDSLLAGAKINKITQPATDEIILQVYASGKNYDIALSANAQTARVCPTKRARVNPQVAPNFCMLLRKHLSGATVTRVFQPGYERMVEITLTAKNDFRENVEKKLVCEIMGKYSNVILTENGKVLGALRTYGGDLSAPRIMLPGVVYTLPPAQDKAEITEKTRVLGAFLNFGGGAADKFISSVVKGVAASTAREAAIGFFGRNDIPPFADKAEEFYGFLLSFLDDPIKKPNVCGGDFYACDYKTVSGEKIFFDSVLEAEEYFFDKKEGEKESGSQKKAIADKLRAHEKKLTKKLQLLSEKELSAADAEEDRIKGELITAYQYLIHAGAEHCELDNYYDGSKTRIALNPDLSANANAQIYYKKYNKKKKTLAAVLPQKEETERELDYISDLFSSLDLCERKEDFEALAEELRQAGLIKEKSEGKKKKELPSMPKTFVSGDFIIKVGKNNLQNDRLTFSAAGNDTWLHAKGFHSAHVIIFAEGRKVPDDVLLFAAEVCAYHSKARGGDKVPVDYCLKKYVKKPPKAKPGGVIYTDYKTVLVTPASHEESELRR